MLKQKSNLIKKVKRALIDIKFYLKIVKNINQIVFFYALKKTMAWEPKKIQKIKNKDIFIVTSCTNPSDNILNFNYNEHHSFKNRYSELLLTIRSIRQFYPNAFVINLENSSMPLKNVKRIINLSDFFYDVSRDSAVQLSRQIKNAKGAPYSVKIIKFLAEHKAVINHKRIFFLSGRYVLNDSVFKTQFSKGLHFKYYPMHDQVSLRHYMICDICVEQIIQLFSKTLFPVAFGRSQEDLIFRTGKMPIHFYPKLGIHGYVNGVQEIYE